MYNYLEQIKIERPLVFLCGVGISKEAYLKKKDRRKILEDYIIENSKDDYGTKITQFQVIPIIVDEIFQDSMVQDQMLSMSLLEEIVSAISFRTYIFLDSMSTSYELGLFTNSRSKNHVHVFLDKEHNSRNNCKIGDYIKKSISKPLIYNAKYNDQRHIYFLNDKLPEEIKDQIDSDIKEIKSQIINDKISLDNEFIDLDIFGNVYYEANEEHISFYVGFKTLFYLIDSVLSFYKNDKLETVSVELIEQRIIESFCLNFIENSNDRYLSNLYMLRRPNANLKIDGYDTVNIIHHMKCIISMFKQYNYSTVGVKNLHTKQTFIYKKCYFNLDVNNLFRLTKNEILVLDDYYNNTLQYVRKFYMTIKGKKRQYITYNNNRKGKLLKSIHTKFYDVLSKITPSSKISFAYKTGFDTKSCVLQHIYSNTFMKLDINRYFNSIKKSIFIDVLVELITLRWQENYKVSTSTYIYKENNKKIIRKKDFAKIVYCCFYNDYLPIGYVSSPIISDRYLYFIDEDILKYTDCIITRYADDYLISSTFGDEFKIISVVSKLTNKLKEYKLKFNNNKRLYKKLIYDGDSIRFLGINIVKTGNFNTITISKSYLLETSKLIYKAFVTKDNSLIEKVKGRCSYINGISKESYEKLKIIYYKRTGYVIPTKFAVKI